MLTTWFGFVIISWCASTLWPLNHISSSHAIVYNPVGRLHQYSHQLKCSLSIPNNLKLNYPWVSFVVHLIILIFKWYVGGQVEVKVVTPFGAYIWKNRPENWALLHSNRAFPDNPKAFQRLDALQRQLGWSRLRRTKQVLHKNVRSGHLGSVHLVIFPGHPLAAILVLSLRYWWLCFAFTVIWVGRPLIWAAIISSTTPEGPDLMFNRFAQVWIIFVFGHLLWGVVKTGTRGAHNLDATAFCSVI